MDAPFVSMEGSVCNNMNGTQFIFKIFSRQADQFAALRQQF